MSPVAEVSLYLSNSLFWASSYQNISPVTEASLHLSNSLFWASSIRNIIPGSDDLEI